MPLTGFFQGCAVALVPDYCSGLLENLSFFSYNSYAGRVQRNLCLIAGGLMDTAIGLVNFVLNEVL